MNIALITSKKWYMRSRGDISLKEALLQAGIHAQICNWEDDVLWEDFDLLILCSPWDYYDHFTDFQNWLTDLKARGVSVANGVDAIQSNIDKVCQIENLSGSPVPFVPSRICHSTQQAYMMCMEMGQPQVVLKPTKSASGHNTFALHCGQDGFQKKLQAIAENILEAGADIIVQPFIHSINDGEYSLVYFHGQFSHGVIRYPGVLGKKKEAVPVRMIEPKWLNAGNAVCSFLQADKLLYCRMDMIEYNNQIEIMEIEIAEPDLYLNLDYGETVSPRERFVQEIVREVFRNENGCICGGK